MNPKSRNNWPTAQIVAAVLLLLFLAGFCWWLQWDPYPRRAWAPGEYERTVKAMKYHGVDVMECDGTGCWFYRKGKRCRG